MQSSSSSSSSPSSSTIPPSTLLRYVPQGEASLYEDAPGWSGCPGGGGEKRNISSVTATPDQQEETLLSSSLLPVVVNGTETTSSALSTTTSASTTTRSTRSTGPLCWKCQGTGTLPPRSKNYKKKKKHHNHYQDRNKTINDDDDDNTPPSPRKESSESDEKKKQNHHQQQEENQHRDCSVCHGTGHLPPKVADIMSFMKPGVITSGRRHKIDWKPSGPLPYALQQQQQQQQRSSAKLLLQEKEEVVAPSSAEKYSNYSWRELVHHANHQKESIEIPIPTVPQPSTSSENETNSSVIPATATATATRPIWLPQPGEELCNLVGSWRILQRVGSHRWTTDDLVTAYCAAQEIQPLLRGLLQTGKRTTTTTTSFSYLDLGTGNGSVLQMVTWALLREIQSTTTIPTTSKNDPSSSSSSSSSYQNSPISLNCWGIEARREAVELARRSIAFNVGTTSTESSDSSSTKDTATTTTTTATIPSLASVQIIHGDFRAVVEQSCFNNSCEEEKEVKEKDKSETVDHHPPNSTKKLFDLVTGTPPYFRVDFTLDKSSSSSSNNNKTTSTNTINNNNNNETTKKDNEDSSVVNNNNNTKKKENELMVVQEVVTKAQIRQGGMPTARQSAPARCEFRGGIEAYCIAASEILNPIHGRFVVCENWSNQLRVHNAAKQAGLEICSIVQIQGKVNRDTPLFAVYTMKLKQEEKKEEEEEELSLRPQENNHEVLPPTTTHPISFATAAATATKPQDSLIPQDGGSNTNPTMMKDGIVPPQISTIAVRTETGSWTEDYQGTVLEYMSIPVPPPTMTPPTVTPPATAAVV